MASRNTRRRLGAVLAWLVAAPCLLAVQQPATTTPLRLSFADAVRVASGQAAPPAPRRRRRGDRKSTRLNSSHSQISYAVFCLKKKKIHTNASKALAHVRSVRRQTP